MRPPLPLGAHQTPSPLARPPTPTRAPVTPFSSLVAGRSGHATRANAAPHAPSRTESPGEPRHARVDRDREHERPDEQPGEGLAPELDPLTRALAMGRPGVLAVAPPVAASAPAMTGVSTLDQLAERLLRRVALGGSRHRGTALLEVGAGLLQGASIVVTAEAGALSIQVEGAGGEAARAWGEGLARRLRERGVEAEVSFSEG